MSDQGFAVYVQAGSQRVRVGTAYRDGDGFTLAFGGLSIGGTPDAPSAQGRAPSGDSGAVFPNYGRSKGAPIRGASMQELEYYAGNARKSIADPEKARWRAKEEALLAALEAEISRQGGVLNPSERLGPERGMDSTPDDSDDIPFN